MTEKENCIASELLSIILEYNYRRYVQCIWSHDAVDEVSFHSMGVRSTHWIDVRNSFTGNLINQDHLFEIFGAYSSEEPSVVRQGMVQLIKAEKNLYSSVGCVALGVRGCDLDAWLDEMENPETVPDKLMLYALSCAYNRHTLVFCKSQVWSTIEIVESMDEMTLMNTCHLQLVYMGVGVYGILKVKPFKGGIPNPVNMERLDQALMKIRG